MCVTIHTYWKEEYNTVSKHFVIQRFSFIVLIILCVLNMYKQLCLVDHVVPMAMAALYGYTLEI